MQSLLTTLDLTLMNDKQGASVSSLITAMIRNCLVMLFRMWTWKPHDWVSEVIRNKWQYQGIEHDDLSMTVCHDVYSFLCFLMLDLLNSTSLLIDYYSDWMDVSTEQ